MTKKTGKLVVISGPSGSGKTSIWKELLRRFGYKRSISVTTRKPRPGEVNGKDYHFVSKTDFEGMISENAFIEYAEVHGNLYGTPRLAMEEAVAKGETYILEIDVQGANQLKERGIAAFYLFIQPPSFEVLTARLVNRKTDSPDVIRRRLDKAQWEMNQAPRYDRVVINADLEQAIAEVHQAIEEYAGEAGR